MKNFDDTDDFDEFESVDLNGSSGRTVKRGYSNMGSAAGTTGGAASRMSGAGSYANSSTGSQYANGSRSRSYVNGNGTGAYTNNNGSGSYAASGAPDASGNMHDLFNDPTFDPTLDDETDYDFDDFDDDFDMHGDPVYTDQTGAYGKLGNEYGDEYEGGYEDEYEGGYEDEYEDSYEDDYDSDYPADNGRSAKKTSLFGKKNPGRSGRAADSSRGAGSSRGTESGVGSGRGARNGAGSNAASGLTSGGRDTGKSRNSDKKSTGRVSSLTRRIIAFAIAEVLVLTGIFSYAFIKRQYNKIQRPDIDISAVTNPNLSIEDIQKMDEGFWTVAIFGLDSRDSSAGKGNNSDVIIVASINRQTGEIKLVSVFRDTYLSIGDGTYNKINAAYCNGGPEQAIKALNENLDLNITQYATFNWKAVATAINMLGGVDVELSKAEFYYINSFITETVKGTGIASVHLKQAGLNHLDGVQAVAYARLRYMDNDYARTERQRKIIGLCFDKVKKTDPSTLLNMAGVMLEMVATNMGWQEASDAVGMLSKLYMGDTGGFPYARGEAVIGKRGSCVIPQTLESNVIELHRQLFGEENYQCSEKVKSIGAKISAESGMYTEGTFIGHVSTQGYIPETKAAAQTAAAETTAAETTESETVESQSSDSWDIESMTDEELQEKIEEYLKDLGIVSDDREYAVSTDGYIVYVAGQDADGLPTYKYVLGNDGKRIKVTEGTETSAAESSSSAESSSGAETSAATKPTAPTAPGGTTEASGPGASKPSATESSATETRAASTETIEAQTTEAVTPGTTTSHSGSNTTTSGTTSSHTSTVTPGSSTSGTSTSGTVTPGSTTTTAAYPGSSTGSDTGGGPGGSSTTTTTTAASAPGSSSSGTSTTGTVTPGSTTTTTAASAPGGSSTEIVPAAP